MQIKKKLFEIINRYLPNHNTNSKDWQKVLDNSNGNPTNFHLLTKVYYYTALLNNFNSINLSMIVYENKKPVGIMPLIVHQSNQGVWILSSNGQEIVEPIFEKKLGSKSRKKFEKIFLKVIIELSRFLRIDKCNFVNMGYFEISKWFSNLIDLADESYASYHLLVDLSLSMDEIRSKFRKSCRYRINQGLKEWKYTVHENISEDVFEEFRILHKDVSQRTTRSHETWKIQKEEIDIGSSFLVTVREQNNSLVGGALFNCSGKMGVYECAAYKRELFDKPIGHPVQIKAIETLKKNGYCWYELGQKLYKNSYAINLNSDSNKKFMPSEKELQISHFKDGFASNIIARQHLTINIPTLSDVFS